MNYKQKIAENSNSIEKLNLKSASNSEIPNNSNKYYKTINFSLLGNIGTIEQSQVKAFYAQPLYIVVLAFNVPENREEPYSIDVSFFFNKPPKSVILKRLKKTKISKLFAHWISSNGLLKPENGSGGFRNINQIMGAAIHMHRYKLCVSSSTQYLSLAKTHLSYLIAQTLCKTQYINNINKAYYKKNSTVIGAFVLKSNNPVSETKSTPIYFLSDYELKQCALTSCSQKQIIAVTKWACSAEPHSADKRTSQLQHLLGDTSAGSSSLVRTSIHSSLVDRDLVTHFQTILELGVLSYLKRPLRQLIQLLIYRKTNESFASK